MNMKWYYWVGILAVVLIISFPLYGRELVEQYMMSRGGPSGAQPAAEQHARGGPPTGQQGQQGDSYNYRSRDGKTQFTASTSADGLERNYPNTIKGIILWQSLEELYHYTDELKDMGVNTIIIFTAHEFSGGKFQVERGDIGMTKAAIVSAKEAGFAVVLTASFVQPDTDASTFGNDIDTHLDAAKAASLEIAEVAEEYNVEYFAPYNEFNGTVESIFFPEIAENRDGFLHEAQKTVDVTNSWHAEMLPEIRERFSGRVIAKVDPVTTDYDFTGYDYVGITLVHNSDTVADFEENVDLAFAELAQVATASGAEWLPVETLIEIGPPQYDETENSAGESLDELQDEYFQATIDSWNNAPANDRAGYIIAGWVSPGSEIKNRPAETVLTNFFGSIDE